MGVVLAGRVSAKDGERAMSRSRSCHTKQWSARAVLVASDGYGRALLSMPPPA